MSEPKKSKKATELSSTAFSLVRGPLRKNNDGDNIPGKWNLVRIKFDLDTGQLGDVSLEEMEDLRYGLERLNVELENQVFAEKEL